MLRADPFQLTTDPLTKPEPLTVRLKAGPAAVALEGDRLVTVGTGFEELIENAAAAELVPWVPEVGLYMVT